METTRFVSWSTAGRARHDNKSNIQEIYLAINHIQLIPSISTVIQTEKGNGNLQFFLTFPGRKGQKPGAPDMHTKPLSRGWFSSTPKVSHYTDHMDTAQSVNANAARKLASGKLKEWQLFLG